MIYNGQSHENLIIKCFYGWFIMENPMKMCVLEWGFPKMDGISYMDDLCHGWYIMDDLYDH